MLRNTKLENESFTLEAKWYILLDSAICLIFYKIVSICVKLMG